MEIIITVWKKTYGIESLFGSKKTKEIENKKQRTKIKLPNFLFLIFIICHFVSLSFHCASKNNIFGCFKRKWKLKHASSAKGMAIKISVEISIIPQLLNTFKF